MMMTEVPSGNFERISATESIDDADNNNGYVPSAVNRGVVQLSILALFLAGFRRDPYPWKKDYSETADGEVGIDLHPDLYLAQMMGPVLISLLVSCNVSVGYVRELFSIIHPPVCLWYALGCIMGYLREVLPVCSFMLEMISDSKVTLYYYQIMIYSSSTERSASILLGTVAQVLGNALLQWICNDAGLIWPNTKYFVDLIVAMVHYFMFCPRESWRVALKNVFEESNRYAFREFIGVAVFAVILLSSINSVILQWLLSDNDMPPKPFLPLLIAFDGNDYIWYTLINICVPIVLEISMTRFNAGKQWIVCFICSFITSSVCFFSDRRESTFYLTMTAMAMTSFTFGKALAHLTEVCPGNKIVLLPGAAIVATHMAMYGFSALLKLIPMALRAKRIVLIAVCCINGAFAVALAFANDLLATDLSRIGRRRVRRIVRTIDL
ncbi:hypothetical protein RP20_CCG024409 [Aedes albopictus]|nr:hypothetical protein RP20_CCG024409 [Aedes albopictus]